MKKEKHRIKKLLIVLGLLLAVPAVGVIVLTAVSMHRSNRLVRQAAEHAREPYTAPAMDFTVGDSAEPLKIDTCEISQSGSLRSIQIYDAAYLDRYFDSVTPAEIKRVIRENDGIGERFKPLLERYVDMVSEKYP